MLPQYLIVARSRAVVSLGRCRECHRRCLSTPCLRCWDKPGQHAESRVCVRCLPAHHTMHEFAHDSCNPHADDYSLEIDGDWIAAEKRHAKKRHAGK